MSGEDTRGAENHAKLPDFEAVLETPRFSNRAAAVASIWNNRLGQGRYKTFVPLLRLRSMPYNNSDVNDTQPLNSLRLAFPKSLVRVRLRYTKRTVEHSGRRRPRGCLVDSTRATAEN